VSARIEAGPTAPPARPLLAVPDLARCLAWRGGRPVRAGAFLAEVAALAARLPAGRQAVNLCEDRYRFLVAFCAVAVAGQTNLLPPSRAPRAIAEVMAAYPGCYALAERRFDGAPRELFVLPPDRGESGATAVPHLADAQIVAIGFTSGSTGAPKAHPKTWAGLCASSALNAERLCAHDAAPNLVATVPPQHMYGLELSILLPLRSAAAIHCGQPFFPADIAAALAALPAPRLLVTTPIHLHALLAAEPELPPLAGIVSATAPLDPALAAQAERRYATRVIEIFGSTETCVIAHRRAAQDAPWQLHPGVRLRPQPDGTLVEAPHLNAPVLLQDIVELLTSQQFILRGRNGDLLEIAGKRASLGDLNRRLLAIPGVVDGVIFPLDPDARGVRRLAALVVAPDVSEAAIRQGLCAAVDPVFLPRPLRRVAALPRNATGKLPREALLAALAAADESVSGER
jgi:acyl-coenzyme A synthetase/AMP-(fatty) acid ligase